MSDEDSHQGRLDRFTDKSIDSIIEMMTDTDTKFLNILSKFNKFYTSDSKNELYKLNKKYKFIDYEDHCQGFELFALYDLYKSENINVTDICVLNKIPEVIVKSEKCYFDFYIKSQNRYFQTFSYYIFYKKFDEFKLIWDELIKNVRLEIILTYRDCEITRNCIITFISRDKIYCEFMFNKMVLKTNLDELKTFIYTQFEKYVAKKEYRVKKIINKEDITIKKRSPAWNKADFDRIKQNVCDGTKYELNMTEEEFRDVYIDREKSELQFRCKVCKDPVVFTYKNIMKTTRVCRTCTINDISECDENELTRLTISDIRLLITKYNKYLSDNKILLKDCQYLRVSGNKTKLIGEIKRFYDRDN